MTPLKYAIPFPVNEIILVGCGGTGGYIAPHLMRMGYIIKQLTNGYLPKITLIDPDEVEVRNVNRQNFILSDVGRNKAEVMAERYSLAFNIPIDFYPGKLEDYIENSNHYNKVKHLNISGTIINSYKCSSREAKDHKYKVLLIDAIDNLSSRKYIHNIMYDSSLQLKPQAIELSAVNSSMFINMNRNSRFNSNNINMTWLSVGNGKTSGQSIFSSYHESLNLYYGSYILPKIFEDKPDQYYLTALRQYEGSLDTEESLRTQAKINDGTSFFIDNYTSSSKILCPSVVEIFREQYSEGDNVEEQTISCALNAIEEPQNLAINITAASSAVEMIYGILFKGITYSTSFFDINNTGRKIPIGKDAFDYNPLATDLQKMLEMASTIDTTIPETETVTVSVDGENIASMDRIVPDYNPAEDRSTPINNTI